MRFQPDVFAAEFGFEAVDVVSLGAQPERRPHLHGFDQLWQRTRRLNLRDCPGWDEVLDRQRQNQVEMGQKGFEAPAAVAQGRGASGREVGFRHRDIRLVEPPRHRWRQFRPGFEVPGSGKAGEPECFRQGLVKRALAGERFREFRWREVSQPSPPAKNREERFSDDAAVASAKLTALPEDGGQAAVGRAMVKERRSQDFGDNSGASLGVGRNALGWDV